MNAPRSHRDVPGRDARPRATSATAPTRGPAGALATSEAAGASEATGATEPSSPPDPSETHVVHPLPPVAREDFDAVEKQLGRIPRGVVEIAARCVCGRPTVVRTAPRLPDGTPFPTTYYLTHPGAVAAVSTLEASGLMAEMTQRLAEDPDLAAAYRAAHQDYLAARAELGAVPEIEGISAGGMPARVKCLHVLVGHSLARGAGVNPLGDEALALIADVWSPARCTC